MLFFCLAVLFAASGRAEERKYELDIPSTDAATGLNRFAEQTGAIMLFPYDLASSREANAVRGSYTLLEGLERLLRGTGLSGGLSDRRVVSISLAEDEQRKSEEGDMPNKNTSIAGKITGLVAAVFSLSSALAQEAEIGGAPLEEIVVSAQRREQSLQDVPVAVTAFNERRLEQIGADTFKDFALRVPGLQMNETGANQATFIIRGVTTQPFTGNIQTTVVPYIDDLPTIDSRSNISTPDLRLFDVERVEVLRGPQGTLFGSGAMGGAIRIVTNKPELDQLASKIRLGVEDTKGGDVSTSASGMLNLPIVEDKFAIRAVGYYRDIGGWLDNAGNPEVIGSASGEEVNSETAYGGRVWFRYQPTDRLNLMAKVSYQSSEPDDKAYYTSIDGEQRIARRDVADVIFEESTIVNLVAEYEFDWAALKSSTSWYDRDGGAVVGMSSFSTAVLPELTASEFTTRVPSESIFQEVTLASTSGGDLSWLVGAFYRTQDRTFIQQFIIPGSEAYLGSGPNGALNDVAFDYAALYETEEEALFGEVSYGFTDSLEATVGFRAFTHSIKQDAVSSGGLWYAGGPSYLTLDSEDSESNYKFSLSYHPEESTLVYATASQGYRVGSPNVVPIGATSTLVPASYGPDSLWNYELGIKSQGFGGRLSVNAAAYYIDWSDMQVTTSTPEGFSYIGNVGEAHSQGLELEIGALFGNDFEYFGAASYTDARIDTGNAALGATAGDRVPGVPKLMFSNSLRKGFAVGERSAYVQLSHQYAGKSYSLFDQQSPLVREMGDYHLVGVRSGIVFDRWEVVLHVDNLLDDDSIVLARNLGGQDQYFPLRPRTIGLTLKTSYF